MEARYRDVSRRMNDLNNDVVLTLGRFDEALGLLEVWAKDYPDDGLARMTLTLIKRCREA